MTDYKATPEQWGNVQKFAAVAGESCILELKRTPSPSQSSSSLVDRVSTAIALEDEKHYWPSTEGDAKDVVESDMARAAIREVAAWMT
ncbi:MAG: hypothetical protein EBR82_87185, partial [Caulobacteraceae bacterium]|nr:hypothetical protein [Caulobacteraceae bacterium]